MGALSVSLALFAEDCVFISGLHFRLLWQLGHDFANGVASLTCLSQALSHSGNISVHHSHS